MLQHTSSEVTVGGKNANKYIYAGSVKDLISLKKHE